MNLSRTWHEMMRGIPIYIIPEHSLAILDSIEALQEGEISPGSIWDTMLSLDPKYIGSTEREWYGKAAHAFNKAVHSILGSSDLDSPPTQEQRQKFIENASPEKVFFFSKLRRFVKTLEYASKPPEEKDTPAPT